MRSVCWQPFSWLLSQIIINEIALISLPVFYLHSTTKSNKKKIIYIIIIIINNINININITCLTTNHGVSGSISGIPTFGFFLNWLFGNEVHQPREDKWTELLGWEIVYLIKKVEHNANKIISSFWLLLVSCRSPVDLHDSTDLHNITWINNLFFCTCLIIISFLRITLYTYREWGSLCLFTLWCSLISLACDR